MTAAAVPVVLFLFNRVETLAQVVDVLVRVRPQLVIAIADGPRPGRPGEAARCAAARAIIDRLDATGPVIRHFSIPNLGCSPRITSGLDWVFEQFSEAIVLEDDVVPDPSFFPWCERMLERYRDQPDVMHVSGRNHLGRWTLPGDGHALLRRASAWGWATWRRAWQRDVTMPGSPGDLLRVAEGAAVDPLVVDHLLMLQELAAVHRLSAWDTDWEIRKGLVGGLSVVPSVNMIANVGFGSEATHTLFADDIGGLVPVRPAPLGATADRCLDDPLLERWQLLVELMASYRNPAMARRLARSGELAGAADWAGDRRFRHHLAPFRDPHNALAALEHFRAAGAPAAALENLIDAMRRASAEMPVPPAKLPEAPAAALS
jgi:hypothetical protein